MSTLQIIGHDFCQVLIKLPDQDSKLVDIIVPLEDLYVTNNQRLEIVYRSKFIFISFFFSRTTNGDERQRSSSTVSSSSSSSSSCSLSSTDGGGVH
jgi:hypothetical protein